MINSNSVKPRWAWSRSAAILILALFGLYGTVAAAGWQFTWSDEFNGTALDTSVWKLELHEGNAGNAAYTDRPQNLTVENGCLVITGLRENYSGHQYTASQISTKGRKSFLYGKFEARMQIDIRNDSWPAWWWLGNGGGWPKNGEIDMMEFYTGDCLFNVMDGNGGWSAPRQSASSLGGARWAAQFHVWTFIWDSTKIDLLLDGVLKNHYLVANADGTGTGGVNPFRQAGFLLFDQAVGGAGGDPSGTTFPMVFYTDWVRRYTWTDAAGYTLTVNGGVGTDTYVAGTPVSITANLPPAGQEFDSWMVTAGSPSIDNVLAASAVLTMPAENVTVTATYRDSQAGADTLPPAVTSVSAVNATTVQVVFSKPVTKASAGLESNYGLDHSATVSSASLSGNGRSATLTVSALTLGTTYTLTLNNIQDTLTPPHTIVPDTRCLFAYVLASKLTGTIIGRGSPWQGNGAVTYDKALDGNTATFSDCVDHQPYVGYDFGAGVQKVITEIRYWPRDGYADRMSGQVFEGSADGTHWTVLYTVNSQPPAGTFSSGSVSDPTGYRYVRFRTDSTSFLNVNEIEFYGYDAPAGMILPAGNLPALRGLTVQSNPVSGAQAVFHLAGSAPGTADLVILDPHGHLVTGITSGNGPSGNRNYAWDTKDVSAGIYVVRAISGPAGYSCKVIVVK